jgi:hypothetical protein
MLNSLFSTVFISPALLIFIIIYLLVIKKIKNDKWEKDILYNSFNEKEKIKYNNYSNKDQSIKNINIICDLKIFFENENINFKKNILFKNNRYYFSINDMEEAFGFKIQDYNKKAYLYIDDKKLVIDYRNNCYKHDREKCFRVPCIAYNGISYVSLIDITAILDLKAAWNYNKKEIRLYRNKDKVIRKPRIMLKKPALIRFEDVTAGSDYSTSKDLQKLRIVADLMYSRELPFHVAWIPRYKKPKAGIDNDLLKVSSMYNADFIFTLDYMLNSGGIIGLHGYTHQNKDGESVDDSEFGKGIEESVDVAVNRVKLSRETAEKLNIPYVFFESPHYSITEAQQAEIESYFDYIYEPGQGMWNSKPELSKRNKKTIYVPTPWGYIKNDNVEEMLDEIRNKSYEVLGSLFYHPYKEFDAIKLSRFGYPSYEYSKESVLNKILNCLDEEEYTLVKITDIKIK